MAVKDFYNVDLSQFGGGKVKLGKKSAAIGLGLLLATLLRRKKKKKKERMLERNMSGQIIRSKEWI